MLYAFAVLDRATKPKKDLNPFPEGLGFHLIAAPTEFLAWQEARAEYSQHQFALELAASFTKRDLDLLTGSSPRPLFASRTSDSAEVNPTYHENVPADLNAFNVSAALRYAEAEYGDDLTFAERDALDRAARKIEKKFTKQIAL